MLPALGQAWTHFYNNWILINGLTPESGREERESGWSGVERRESLLCVGKFLAVAMR